MTRWWAAFIGNKQVNGRALLILILALVVGLGGTYLVHGFQVRRNAGGLLEQAGVTEADGDKIQAIMYLEQYLGLMPGDGEAMAKLALLLSQETENERAQGRAYLLYDDLLRREEGSAADRLLYRRKAAKLAIRLRPPRYAEAKQQLLALVDESGAEADPETLQLQGQAEVGLGNNAEAEGFYKKAMANKPSPAIVFDYATLLRKLLRKPADADKVINDLLKDKDTPQNVRFEATRYYVDAGQPAKAWEQLEFIAESPSPSEEVLQLAGEVALALDKNVEAQELFERGRQLFPKNQRLSRDLALIAIRAGDISKAKELLDPLLRDPPKDVLDLWNLADSLIDINEFGKARRVMEMIPRATGGGLVDYLEARLLMEESQEESKWGKAAEYLESARNDPRFVKRVGRPANLLLAQCAEHLLNAEQRLKALQRAVELDPGGSSAIPVGRALALAQAAAGEIEPALARLRQLAFFSKPAAQRAQIDEDIIRLLIDRNRALPPDRRDWREAAERLLGERAEFLATRTVGTAVAPAGCNGGPSSIALLLDRLAANSKNRPMNLLWAQVLFLQGKIKDASDQAIAERKQNPDKVEPWLFLISLKEIKEGVAAAGEELDKAEKQLKNKVEWPLMRAQLLLKQGPAEARKDLPQLLKSLEQFQGADRDRLLAGFAKAFSIAGDMPEARRLWRELAEGRPDDLQVRFTLFEAALQAVQADDKRAAALQADDLREATQVLKKMHAIEGADGPLSTFGEGALRVAQAQTGDKTNLAKTLAEARVYFARAAALHPAWAQVSLFEAAAFELEGQEEKALEKYRLALDRGERRSNIVKHVLELMWRHGLSNEAGALVNSLDESARKTPELGQIVGATLMKTGAQREALEMARAAAEHSEKVSDYHWLATLARVTARTSTDEQKKLRVEAEAAYKRACELESKDPENWLALISFLVEIEQKKQAEETLEQAEQKLGKEKGALVLATGADLLGQNTVAEQRFETLRARRGNDPLDLRAAAGFYIRHGNLTKAADTLRTLLGPGVKATEDDMAWGRRHWALVLAHQGDQDSMDQANKLLEQAGSAEQRTPEYRIIKAEVCAQQPGRHGEAIKIIEGLANQAPLAEGLRFMLARLYEADPERGRRADAEAQLSTLVREHKENFTYLDHYVSVLLLQRKTSEAQVWFEKLQKLDPKARRTNELEIELLLIGKTNDKNRVINLVSDYAREKDAHLDWAAGWFELLGQKEKAESAYREFAKSSTQPASMLPLALHLAKNNKIAEALAICERAWATAPPEAVARATVTVVRAGQAEAAQLEAAERSLIAALKNAPESKTLPFYLAEFYEYQNRPNESIGLYQLLLERDRRNVAALNNLAYFLALAQDETTEALKWINEAISLDRANAELLDTRALIYLKQNQAAPALRDLRDAFAHAPTAARYFHLARARLLESDKAGAAEAWTKALQMGLEEAGLHPLERPDLVKLREELK